MRTPPPTPAPDASAAPTPPSTCPTSPSSHPDERDEHGERHIELCDEHGHNG